MSKVNAVGFRRGAMLVAIGMATVASASDWYVDPVNGSDAYDGTTSNVVSGTVGPCRTLFYVATKKAEANDTVWLMPGVYAEGSGTATDDTTRRLRVSNRPGLKFRAVGNRDNTVIAGGDGIGCVRVDATAANVVFEGITFRGGRAPMGAGLRDYTKSCWVIGCRFEDCVASSNGGAMIYGLASGTEFVGCTSKSNARVWYCGTYAEFCGFRNEGDGSSQAFTQGGTFVNCTIVGFNGDVFNNADFKLYNSVVIGNVDRNGENNGASADNTLSAYNSCLGVSPHTLKDSNTATRTGVTAEVPRLVAAVTGDFRPADTSEVLAMGDAAWLSTATLPSGVSQTFPAGFVRRDLNGHPVTATSGPIAAGCVVADFPKQTHGGFVFRSDMAVREFGGTIFRQGDGFTPVGESYAFAFKPTTSAVVQYIKDENDSEPNRNIGFAMPDGWFPMTAMPETAKTRALSTYTASQVVYADAVNGNDEWDGTALKHGSGLVGPKKTLSGAVAAVGTGRRATIFALPGVYDEGTDGVYANKAAPRDPSMNGVRYRVHVESTRTGSYVTSVNIVSREGPEKTFIVGAPDPTTGGTGPEAIGGVWFESGIHSLRGFTITGCYGPTETSAWPMRGAAFNGGGSSSTHVLDCIVTNNTAVRAAATSYGTVLRCRICDNHAAQYVCEKSDLGGCVFAGNVTTSESEAMVSGGNLQGCTFDGGDAADGRPFCDSITAGATLGVRYGGPVVTGVFCDPLSLVADAGARDYRLGSLSAARGRAAVGELARATRFLFPFDIDGNPVEIIDGRLTFGALHDATRMPACFAVRGANGDAVEGGCRTNLVLAAEETVTVLKTRPFVRFEVNGVAQPDGMRTVTVTPSTEPGAATVVTAVFGNNWYVNAAAADDQSYGDTPATARRTIRSVTANALPGDVINVAHGIYGEAEGTALVGGRGLPNRVVLPAGVTLAATDGPDATFIVGAASPDAGEFSGNGPGAVRGIYSGDHAEIRGFTITGGHTLQELSEGDQEEDRHGGAVFSVDKTVRIVDCVISNNAAYCGVIHRGKVIRCGVLGNTGTCPLNAQGNPNASGAAGEECDWYGCVIDGNCGNATLYLPGRIEFCTLGAGNYCYNSSGERGAQVLYCSMCQMFNSVIYGERNTTYGTRLYATNCLFRTGLTTLGWDDEPYRSNRGDCICTNDANITVDAGYCPVFGAFAGIDRGDLSLSDGTLFTDIDLTGGQRIQNGTIDIGAVEYDWKSNYAAALNAHARVTAADPNVVEDANGVVTLADGCTMAVTFAERAGCEVHYLFEVVLPGTGVFRIRRADGTVLAERTSSGQMEFSVLGPSEDFVLEYLGDGSASFAHMKRDVGFSLIIR